MRIALASDIHGGLGENDPALRDLQSRAVQSAVSYLEDQKIDRLILNGDTTDHLANRLAGTTNREIALEVMAPLVAMVKRRRLAMKTLLVPGNTDWVLADPDAERRNIFFDYTGLDEQDVELPGLWTQFENDDLMFRISHGHGMKPAFWPQERPLTYEGSVQIWDKMNHPDSQFLDLISATSGSHRKDYLKAVAIGSVVKVFSWFVRQAANNVLGKKFTTEYEEFYAETLRYGVLQTRKKVLGAIGHTHIEGIREYQGVTVLNTGTTGAKPNPLQRKSDPQGHIAIVDMEHGTYDLIRTYNAARPNAKPERVGGGTFAELS